MPGRGWRGNRKHNRPRKEGAMTRQRDKFSRSILRAVGVVLVLPIVVPLALIALTLGFAHRAALYALVWMLWLPRGRDILFVYSDSPIWHEYMTTRVLPLVQPRAFVLNWSERNRWPWLSLPVSLFHSFGGGREFNPMVIVFRPFARARAFRFWRPFQDWKRGYREPVERLRQELSAVL
jgi:hypothetical protein